jgi:steroid delta-isomerase-like uncharacterized protein
MGDTPKETHAMTEECSTLVHEWFERVWNQGRSDAIDELLADDAIVHGLEDASGNALKGPEGFKPLHHAFRTAFPDLTIEVEECLTDGDRMAFRCKVRGTHHGDGLGVAPTGREVEFMGMGFVRVRDGKIVEAWNTFDFQSMNAQLGGGA